MLIVDGSYGEGGGQVLRTALSLSCVLGLPVRVTDIRARRPKPGLAPQHLTGVLALAEVCSARVEGAREGSTEIAFAPGLARPGRYSFDVSKIRGSAGSVTLVLQAVMPALWSACGASGLRIAGGTHVAWSPPFHFVSDSLLPALAAMGLASRAELEKWGFYPKGGGVVQVSLDKGRELKPLVLEDRGSPDNISLLSAVANLPEGIAKRQATSMESALAARGFASRSTIVSAESPGQGTFAYIRASFRDVTLGFSALGERGKPAEAVGDEAARSFLAFMDTGACVDERLADQLVLYMALAKGTSRVTVSRISRHLLTNVWVIKKLMPTVRISVHGKEGGQGPVEVEGAGVTPGRT